MKKIVDIVFNTDNSSSTTTRSPFLFVTGQKKASNTVHYNSIDLIHKKKKNYCKKYKTKFDFYCQGPGKYIVNETNTEKLSVFCISYKENCLPVIHLILILLNVYSIFQDRVACTSDCDPNIHPHCTVDCKCDHLFSFVVKFCSPSSLWVPSLEQLCNSWFLNCASRYSLKKKHPSSLRDVPIIKNKKENSQSFVNERNPGDKHPK